MVSVAVNKVSTGISAISQFTAISFSLTFLLLAIFFSQFDMPSQAISFAYFPSIPLYYYFIVLFLVLLLLPLYFIPYVAYIIIVPKVLFDLFLIADFLVFNVYRFHIDMMFINMMIHDMEGIGVSFSLIIYALLTSLVIFSINGYIFYRVRNTVRFNVGKLNVLLFLIFLIGQLIYVWGNEYRKTYITLYNPYFPYYMPLTSHSLMKKLQKSLPKMFPSTKLGQDDKGSIFAKNAMANGLFNYPKQNVIVSPQNKHNVLFVVIESWRADMLKADIMPNMVEFSQKNYVFNNHFSGGSVTVTGLFSLMYGLHPTYLDYAQASPYTYQTVLTKSLAEAGYDIEAYVSTNLTRFSLKPMFFGDIADDKFHYEKKGKTYENDKYLVERLTSDLQNASTTKPWFKFIFLSSSHHDYKYPDSFKKFTPTAKNKEAFLFNKHTDAAPLLNDYKNSLFYVDSLFADIKQALQQYGDNTIVVITGDHGEGFNDNNKGYWGHGSNFTRYQSQVPLLVHLPKQNQGVVINELSAHIDIVPTILHTLLKTDAPINTFSSGADLFSLPRQRGIVQKSYKNKAYLIGKYVYSTDISVDSYSLDNISHKNENFDYKSINLLKQEELSFLK